MAGVRKNKASRKHTKGKAAKSGEEGHLCKVAKANWTAGSICEASNDARQLFRVGK